jgi:hypothetical protein
MLNAPQSFFLSLKKFCPSSPDEGLDAWDLSLAITNDGAVVIERSAGVHGRHLQGLRFWPVNPEFNFV